MTTPHKPLAIASQNEETKEIEITVTGSMPGWLHGRLLRNGPAMFEYGDNSVNHWFDGFAKLHSFQIHDSRRRWSIQ